MGNRFQVVDEATGEVLHTESTYGAAQGRQTYETKSAMRLCVIRPERAPA